MSGQKPALTLRNTDFNSVRLTADGLSKKFYFQWVFKEVSFEAEGGDRLLLTGPNGSGKSTLVKILAGQLHPTKGKITLTLNGEDVPDHHYYRHLSWVGPYTDLYPELSLREMVHLHFRFKPCVIDEVEKVISELALEKHADKLLSHFSSGMLHRLKVGLCIFSHTPLLILDEPGTNLDEQNMEFIYQLLDKYLGNRLLIFVSNNPSDFPRFEKRVDLKAFIAQKQ